MTIKIILAAVGIGLLIWLAPAIWFFGNFFIRAI